MAGWDQECDVVYQSIFPSAYFCICAMSPADSVFAKLALFFQGRNPHYFGDSSYLGSRPTLKRQREMKRGSLFQSFEQLLLFHSSPDRPLADLELPGIICKVDYETVNFYKWPLMTEQFALRHWVLDKCKMSTSPPRLGTFVSLYVLIRVFSALSGCAER